MVAAATPRKPRGARFPLGLLAVLAVTALAVRNLHDRASSGDELDMEAAAALRQCPARRPGYPVQSVALIHIPKTAGSFLQQALRALLPQQGRGRYCTWGPDRDLPAVFSTCATGAPGPDHVALFDATRAAFLTNCSGVSAHQDVAYFDAVGVDYSQTMTVTALRHPVDRALSAYFYSLRQGAPFVKGYEPKNDSDWSGLLRFVADDPADAANLMTRMLGGGRHCSWPGTAAAPPPHRLLEAAKRNLARVCVLVLSEFMDESLVRLARAGGWGSRRVLRLSAELEAAAAAAHGTARVNAAPDKPAVTADVRLAVERANQLDMQLYEFALRLFMRRSLGNGGGGGGSGGGLPM